MEGACEALAVQIGKGFCGKPPFATLPRRVLSLLLRLPSAVAKCARCVSAVPELQDASESIADYLASGISPIPVSKVLRNSTFLETPEAADAMGGLLQLGQLMDDFEILSAPELCDAASRA